MYNPQLIADRQRDIKIVEGQFGDYPGAKWRQREPSSTAFGDVSPVIQGAVQRGRVNRDDNASTRFAGFRNVLIASAARRPRYNGFGGFSRFGAYGDDSWGGSLEPPTLLAADDGSTQDFSASIGYVPDSSGGTGATVAVPADTGPSVWDRLFGAASDASSSTQVQNAGGGLVGSVLSALGIGNKKTAVTNTAQPKSNMPLILGGAAVLAGLYLVTRHH